ncbi:MAG: hypothetical protein IKR50_07410 [Prevotella sp.]|nr:hypothetical protein [Prevotella sp.]
MNNIAIYTLTSELHNAQAVDAETTSFLASLQLDYDFKGSNFDDYGSHPLSLIYVRTGGTEGIFKPLLPALHRKSRQPFCLLTSGKSNSLAASMEILSFLRQNNLVGEIIHGSATYMASRIALLAGAETARRQLVGCRLGVVGEPSDWLISSQADYAAVRRRLGIELVDIPMSELLRTIAATPEVAPVETSAPDAVRTSLPGAYRIYGALKSLVGRHRLQGFTLRCFDLLTTTQNTGCMALARLNAEGYVAGCEGDVPAMLSMAVIRAITGLSGFQANPATVNPETGEILFAHCTIPLNMVQRYDLDTHFESGIGVGIRGYMEEGPVTLFKVSGDLSRCFIAEGTLVSSQALPGLCRTQQVIQLAESCQASYFLTNPIGNHHIIVPGHHKALLEQIMA